MFERAKQLCHKPIAIAGFILIVFGPIYNTGWASLLPTLVGLTLVIWEIRKLDRMPVTIEPHPKLQPEPVKRADSSASLTLSAREPCFVRLGSPEADVEIWALYLPFSSFEGDCYDVVGQATFRSKNNYIELPHCQWTPDEKQSRGFEASGTKASFYAGTTRDLLLALRVGSNRPSVAETRIAGGEPEKRELTEDHYDVALTLAGDAWVEGLGRRPAEPLRFDYTLDINGKDLVLRPK